MVDERKTSWLVPYHLWPPFISLNSANNCCEITDSCNISAKESSQLPPELGTDNWKVNYCTADTDNQQGKTWPPTQDNQELTATTDSDIRRSKVSNQQPTPDNQEPTTTTDSNIRQSTVSPRQPGTNNNHRQRHPTIKSISTRQPTPDNQELATTIDRYSRQSKQWPLDTRHPTPDNQELATTSTIDRYCTSKAAPYNQPT
jgi:hypothetical protein